MRDLFKQGCSISQASSMTGISYEKVKHQRRKWGTERSGDISGNPVPEAWKKPLCECYPREIFAYLKHLGYKGVLEYVQKVEI